VRYCQSVVRKICGSGECWALSRKSEGVIKGAGDDDDDELAHVKWAESEGGWVTRAWQNEAVNWFHLAFFSSYELELLAFLFADTVRFYNYCRY